jgi:hypothetical protein
MAARSVTEKWAGVRPTAAYSAGMSPGLELTWSTQALIPFR